MKTVQFMGFIKISNNHLLLPQFYGSHCIFQRNHKITYLTVAKAIPNVLTAMSPAWKANVANRSWLIFIFSILNQSGIIYRNRYRLYLSFIYTVSTEVYFFSLD